MAVFTRFARVLDASGQEVTVREALALINQTLDEVLAEQEGDFDADTRWALAWFEQSGFDDGDYGVAETLSTAKNTSVAGMVEAGILRSGVGKVRLLRPQELPEDWAPDSDNRLIAWEAVHHLVRVHDKEGEGAAARADEQAWPECRGRSRVGLPPLSHLRPEAPFPRGPGLQCARAELAGGRAPGSASCQPHAGENGVAR